MKRRATVALLVAVLSPLSMASEKFAVDTGHSKIGFRVTLAKVADVDGRFSDYDATITYNEADPTKSSVTATIKTASINTSDTNRDNDLKGASFFDVAKYPTIRFQSKSIEKRGNDYVMTGALTIRDGTREVSIPVAWQQHKGPDLWGNTRIGFQGQLTLQRKDYGVAGPAFWNNAISNEVEVELRISAEIPNFDLWGFPSPDGKKPVGAVVYDTIEKEGLQAAIQQYKTLKQEHPDTYAFTPGQLSLVGRRLLQHGKNQEALEILKMNAELFPNMAGIADSLGDAYVAVGDNEHAIQTFKKSLAIDPTDTSAAESLRTLTHG